MTSTPVTVQDVSPTASQTRTPRPTVTRTATSTPSRVPSPTRTPLFRAITIYFTDNERLIAGQLPYEVPVKRFVPTSKRLVNSVLDEFFEGPGDVERNQGLALINNGFTGYKRVTFVNGGVYVYLDGSCMSNGTLYNITRTLMLSLKEIPDVQFVKIYDQFGYTREPAARVDSIPACLDPSFTPSVTPLPTSTLAIRVTPTRTPRPTLVPFSPGR